MSGKQRVFEALKPRTRPAPVDEKPQAVGPLVRGALESHRDNTVASMVLDLLAAGQDADLVVAAAIHGLAGQVRAAVLLAATVADRSGLGDGEIDAIMEQVKEALGER